MHKLKDKTKNKMLGKKFAWNKKQTREDFLSFVKHLGDILNVLSCKAIKESL